jgi:hypothetical protein
VQVPGLLPAYFDSARPTARRIADMHGNIIQTIPSSDNPEIDRNDLRRILMQSLQPGTVVWTPARYTGTVTITGEMEMLHTECHLMQE